MSLHRTSKARYRHFTALYMMYLTESFIEEMGLKLLLEVLMFAAPLMLRKFTVCHHREVIGNIHATMYCTSCS